MTGPGVPEVELVTVRAGISDGLHDFQPSPRPAAVHDPAQCIPASCFTSLPAGAAATQYKIPQSVTTSETLTNVSLSGDRIDSMFPAGQIASNDEITWQGTSGLSPSLSATNLSSAESSSKAGFLAGLLYGLAAGLFIPFLQDVSQAVKVTRPREQSPGGSGGQGVAEPTVAGPSRS